MLSLKAIGWLFATAVLTSQPCVAGSIPHKFRRTNEKMGDQEMHQNNERFLSLSAAPASTTFTIVMSTSAGPFPSVSPTPIPASCASSSCRYYNDKTAPYFIEEWPDIDFDVGEIYGGSIPIDESDPSRTLFFIFKPAEVTPVDEVTIWLNGGPGCSSMEGFLQENGPFTWKPGTFRARQNPFAWSKLTNMLWVEQPVRTGFSQGKVTASNDSDLGKDFVGFFKNWQVLFGIENYKIFISGESYAGFYIPYISAAMLDENDQKYFDLSGALIYDPCIGDCGTVQSAIPIYQFALDNQAILNLDQTTLDAIGKTSADCGMTAYMETYLKYPPPGNQPTEHEINSRLYGNCTKNNVDVSEAFYLGTVKKNPCFNSFHIVDFCPSVTNVLSNKDPYFNRTDVKKAIHAPLNVDWTECTYNSVYTHDDDDTSLPSIQGVLPQVIEATNRVLVANGDWDAELFTKGTLLSIQNMTWNGKLGFQEAPSADFVVPLAISPGTNYSLGPQGVMGKQHYERGLMWVETYQAGHQQPQYQPMAAWQHLQWVLGRIDDLGQ